MSFPTVVLETDMTLHNDTKKPASPAPCWGNGGTPLFTVQDHVTKKQVAKLLNSSTRTVDRLLAEGRLTKVKLLSGKQGPVRIPYRAVLNYLKGMKKEVPPVTTQATP
jgi:excisionase family DNA binding protein